ncbi:lipopolysaccharide-induced tumor necrosis factor-alpha factor homolog [Parambassis ranga]|uniref:Lipopolysaccharide-induced tumor necrosis factor-alpha factor homolog n=1 Tax=Parambassis ranga TaxID=210632 RepID=A0A6P7IT13_9TELE|nr:lipopolysaccharide-induced tumor necrosis factor-alpha factor homolog [Parambassis ranga]
MESLSNVDESFPTPPPYFLPDNSKSGQDVRIYQIPSAFSPPPPSSSFSFSPGVGCSTQTHSPLPVSAPPLCAPTPKFVSYQTELYRSPGLTTCPSCRTQVTTQVTFRAGTHAWLMCFVFVLCGLVLGCCLIPFFVNHFKDAFHTCPRCRLVLHVQKRRCYE